MSGSTKASRWRRHRLVTLAINGAIAEIGLDSGPLNLVTKAMLRALNRVLGEVTTRADVRCLILHGGSARAFCAGSDIKEFEHLRQDASEHKILFEDMVLRRLARMPMPTIAAIDGPALGGGLELALACDLRVCRKDVALGLTESRLGGLAGSGAVRLTRLIGPARAKEMLYTGETIAAEQALAWGLVNRVVEGSALDGARGAGVDDRRPRTAIEPPRQEARGCRAGSPARRRSFDVDDRAAGDLRQRRPARGRRRVLREARARVQGAMSEQGQWKRSLQTKRRSSSRTATRS